MLLTSSIINYFYININLLYPLELFSKTLKNTRLSLALSFSKPSLIIILVSKSLIKRLGNLFSLIIKGKNSKSNNTKYIYSNSLVLDFKLYSLNNSNPLKLLIINKI